MGRADKECFELGGGKVNAPFEHFTEENSISYGIGFGCAFQIDNRSFGKESAPKRGNSVERYWNSCRAGRFLQPRAQVRVTFLNLFVNPASVEHVEHRQPRAHGQWVPGKSSSL